MKFCHILALLFTVSPSLSVPIISSQDSDLGLSSIDQSQDVSSVNLESEAVMAAQDPATTPAAAAAAPAADAAATTAAAPAAAAACTCPPAAGAAAAVTTPAAAPAPVAARVQESP